MELWLLFVAAVVPAAFIAWYDARLFALYAFAVVVGLMLFGFQRLWTLLRVSHASNAAKIMVVAKRVGANDEDFTEVADGLRASDPLAWASIAKAAGDLESQ
jgi:hypothetical protein